METTSGSCVFPFQMSLKACCDPAQTRTPDPPVHLLLPAYLPPTLGWGEAGYFLGCPLRGSGGIKCQGPLLLLAFPKVTPNQAKKTIPFDSGPKQHGLQSLAENFKGSGRPHSSLIRNACSVFPFSAKLHRSSGPRSPGEHISIPKTLLGHGGCQ